MSPLPADSVWDVTWRPKVAVHLSPHNWTFQPTNSDLICDRLLQPLLVDGRYDGRLLPPKFAYEIWPVHSVVCRCRLGTRSPSVRNANTSSVWITTTSPAIKISWRKEIRRTESNGVVTFEPSGAPVHESPKWGRVPELFSVNQSNSLSKQNKTFNIFKINKFSLGCPLL